MFIPKSLYEKAPFFWVVLGILLVLFGIYYGKAGDRDFFLAGLGGGAFAVFWGLLLFGRRLARESRKPCSTYDEYLDQTMELNLRDGSIPGRPTPADSPAPE